ncbi:succinyl-diaminopimelate desuccinylase [Lactococcus hodotermopsidis]|uniref:Probable succinyl-diaminopimelate desuccinylase n=1 Tax=Pseudolactococcus hodotermopsidis TaxID=2709157 RepID=A0A6A0BAN5_9LACT|nr:ArgE/DapE family deacylase [Lactococcus hodotermopsidis]GFH41866.1 succinyl-diaminopimelate desuccinylase [Lactococcus hodotermopsidis]
MDNRAALTLLKEVIQIKSILGDEKLVADKLQTIFEAHDIPCQQIIFENNGANRSQLIATLEGTQGDGKTLAFSGHMDVVAAGDIPWEFAPFAAIEADGKLYGRGTCDMKAGLIAQVVALIRLKHAGANFKGTIKFIATAGEETAAIGSGALVSDGLVDDIDALIIGEPTDLGIAVAHKGALWPRITTYGKTAHGSMPNTGVNAIEHMLLVLAKFKEKFDFASSIDDLVGASTSSIDVMNGGFGTNVVPDKCTVEIDIRTIKSQNHADLKAQFAELLADLTQTVPNFKAEVNYINDLPSMKTALDDEFALLAQKVVSEIKNEPVTLFGITGYTDGSQFSRLEKDLPILILGPAETKYAHQPNEFVKIADFYRAIDIYETVAKRYFLEN